MWDNYEYFEKDSKEFDAGFMSPRALQDPVRRLVQRLWKKSGPYNRFKEALKLIPVDIKGLSILDVGCGHGHCSLILASMGANVTGVDYSGKMIEIVEANLKKIYPESMERCSFKHANIFEYNSEEKFDIVMALGVIEYINEKLHTEFMRKLSILSKKYLLIAFPQKYSMFYILRKPWLKYLKKCIVTHFSMADVRRIISSIDCHLIREVDHGGYWLCLLEKK
jgi:2-polyprenyl-3-methyl-5-hydroxy-6-metoxy-1,4-benzoquinol methylase